LNAASKPYSSTSSGLQRRRVLLLAGHQQLRRARMNPEGVHERFQQRAQLGRPGSTRLDVGVDLVPDLAGQGVEQFVLGAEVPVERHRGDPEFPGQPADGQRLQALGVGERDRPVDYCGLAQLGPLRLRRTAGRSRRHS
jgi:hypothetical protein